ncbi:hypothetical protein TanjilG_25608 [Lupinus angustifolius]|uniref:Phospholipid-transporting ATPase n=1 Tax=Lupinus angustifolius TaxID=3871 RepID=A0A4P1QTG5_LUPAN|nr:hypothetical protein TanjilG_25608 [Lupinus angustifolius]
MSESVPSTRTVRLGRVKPQAPGHRTIFCNDREANLPVRFKDCLNSPVSPITNVLPLSVVLLLSLIKEAFEDWKRFQNDMVINNNTIDVLQDEKWVSIPWKKLQVGDIVKGCSLRNTEYIVGVVIFTGHETKLQLVPSVIVHGHCFIDTWNTLQVMMNAMNVPSKRSTLERKLDKLILILFATLFMMCFIGAVGRNLMEFFKCSIGGEIYGNGLTETEKGLAERNGVKLEENITTNAVRERGFNFNDARLMSGAWRNEPNPDSCKEFFRCLAICHTVLPEGDESPEKIRYQAASPDESALVIAAKNFGFFFYRRTPTTIYVRESHVEKMGKIQDVSYEILNVLEFNSTRKRQSVVCRYPDGRLVLYCKGADTVIFERLADDYNSIKKVTREHLEQFGCAGLRTLCLAYKDLHPDVYESWNEKFINAKSSLHDREKKLDEVAELIENDLILIGSTAIEDKLQEGVPACIETLQRAGIKIWVLTGDKIETAINIAYACNLINNEMKQFIISSETDAIREVEDRGDQVEIARFIKEEVKRELKKCLEEAQSYVSSISKPKLALVIDGKCLMYALDPSLRVMLLKFSLSCHAVVCCRVSPLQKAQVTSLVRKGAKKITLSIGDGANDVSMIQAAHVGVGISGLEGMQAVMASDFAIAQFRYLADLLLVHGRWSYFRICKIIQEMHRQEYDDTGREQLIEMGGILSPAEAKSHGVSQLPQEISKHTGFAFDSPGYESFFAAQLGIYAPQKAWDVARRASMKPRLKIGQKK